MSSKFRTKVLRKKRLLKMPGHRGRDIKMCKPKSEEIYWIYQIHHED
jgi:hypothetical protein